MATEDCYLLSCRYSLRSLIRWRISPWFGGWCGRTWKSMFLRMPLISGFWAVRTNAPHSNCPQSLPHNFKARVVLPIPATPTMDTTLSCSSPLINHLSSSSVGPSMPTRSSASDQILGSSWPIRENPGLEAQSSNLYRWYR